MKIWLLAAALVSAASAASADEIRLIFATTNPTEHSMNTRVQHPWADAINQAGKGIVQLDVRDGPTVANQGNFYERAMDDVVQVTWGLQSQIGGKFPRSGVATLPFIVDEGEHASVAFWQLYKTGLLDAEYADIHPFFFCAFAQYSIHTAKPMPSVDDLHGLKFGINSKVGGEIVSRLGGTPISLLLSDLYSSLERGTIDGILNSTATLAAFKLNELTSYHVTSRLGAAVGMTFITKKRWNALPPEAQKVFDDASGEARSRSCGSYVNENEVDTIKAIAADPKQKIVALTAAQNESWRKRVAPVVDEWAAGTPDGPAVLARFRALSEAAMAGH